MPVRGEALFSTLDARVRTQNLSLFFTSTLLPNRLSNELRFSYGRTRLKFGEAPVARPDEVGRPFLRPSSRLPNVPFLLNARRLVNAAFPDPREPVVGLYEPSLVNTETDTDPIGQVIVSGYSPLGVDVFNFPQNRVNNTFQAADTAIHNLINHRFIGGVDFRRTQLNSNAAVHGEFER